MKPRRYTAIRIILTILPLAVLLTLFGLWLIFTPPQYVESALVATLALALFVWIGIRFVPQLMDWFIVGEKDLLPQSTGWR
ncbi:MAG: hypothetical protein FWE69_04515, partial [Clostridiales bacterium]|nr:hypothetical protein [Clostridiales bacterium]